MPRKPIDKTKTLLHARARGDVERFIRAHEQDDQGDLDRLEAAIRKPAETLETASKAPKTSRKPRSGG